MNSKDASAPIGKELFKVMNDPTTIGARIFIGKIPPQMQIEEIQETFSKYGRILGLNPKSGFAFVQYDNEKSAADAIENENGSMYYGRRIDVKGAQRKEPMGGGGPPHPMDRDRSPLHGGPMDLRDQPRDWRERERFEGPGFNDRGSGFGRPDNISRDLDEPLRGRGLSVPADFPPADPLVPGSERANDCEIIVVNKEVREYAEFIERRLIKIGLTVDLLFPNEEVPLGRVLASISGRGTLFAVIVTLLNQEHRSLTLNILYGQPQEHRNMPLEDALVFINRSFDMYLRRERAAPGALAVGLSLPDRHPEAIQNLLNLLKENHQLTVLQYDKVIKYLQEKRDIQLKLEVGDDQGLPLLSSDKPLLSKQQAELQNRILNILNQSGQGNQHPPQGVPPPRQQQQQVAPATPAPLLNDPTVQKALDSLIQGDLLKKMTPGSQGLVRPSQPLFGAYIGNRR